MKKMKLKITFHKENRVLNTEVIAILKRTDGNNIERTIYYFLDDNLEGSMVSEVNTKRLRKNIKENTLSELYLTKNEINHLLDKHYRESSRNLFNDKLRLRSNITEDCTIKVIVDKVKRRKLSL